jgi:hypothetical protein
MKCIVKGCENHPDDGMFVGPLCYPCHEMLTKGVVHDSSAWFAQELKQARNGTASFAAALVDFQAAYNRLPSLAGYQKPTFVEWVTHQLRPR